MARSPGALLVLLLTGALILGFSVIAAAQTSGSGVGVAPASLHMDDPPLIRGGGKVGILQFQQHDHELAHVVVSIHNPSDGDHGDASSWITLDPPAGRIEVPRTADYPVEVEVAVPETAANGLYAARVNFLVEEACDADGGACVGVQASASATVYVRVEDGEEVKQIAVLGSLSVHDMETGSDFQFSLELENTGNVDAVPQVKLEILDKFQEEVITHRWLNDTLLRPGERGDHTFIVPDLDLPEDQYWARVNVHLDGVSIHESGVRTFDVVPPGTLAQTAELRTIRIDGDLTSARVGELIRMEAIVENTGAVPVLAQFQGTVEVDGRLVDRLESDQRQIPIGATQGIEMFYTVEHPGQHVFKGQIHYGSKITEERSLLLSAQDTGGIDLPAWAWFVLGGLVPVALVGMFLLGRRGAGKRSPAQPKQRRRPPRGQAPAKRAPAKRAPANGRRAPPERTRVHVGPPRKPPGRAR